MVDLFGGNKKQIIGLAVTPNLGLEACVFDKNTGEVVKYGQNFIEYNIASKEIQDDNAFRSAISDVFNDLNISKDSANLYLVLPNVFCGFRSIDDSSIDDDAIESMILSEAGESYIFKNEEAVSAWVDVNAKTGSSSKYIAFSSIQRKVVDAIQDAAMDVGVTISGIESSASAIPRGVAVSGLCNDVISNNLNWNILTINPNGYAITQMAGARMLDYVETPFAIMSFEGEEVYSALASAIAQYLPNYPAKKLVITSFTDNVSAKLLKDAIVFDEEVVVVNSNKYGTSPIVRTGPDVIKQTASAMSLAALGAAVPGLGRFATLNVLGNTSYDGDTVYGEIEMGENTVEITASLVVKYSIIACVILGLLAVLICGSLFGMNAYYDNQNSVLETQINARKQENERLEAKINSSIVTLIKQISENNATAIKFYDSLSSDIPQHVWLTYYINKNGKEVGIEGFSMEIQDVYEYYKSLKILAPSSDIKLNKLDVFKEENTMTGDEDEIVLENNAPEQQTFAFEISNTSYTKYFDEKGNAASSGAANAQNGNKSYATKIPSVPDVEINLKEIK